MLHCPTSGSTHLLEVVGHGHKCLCQKHHQDHGLLHPALLSILPKDQNPAEGGRSAGAQHLRETQTFCVSELTPISLIRFASSSFLLWTEVTVAGSNNP